MKQCLGCGFHNPDEARFCEGCGKAFSETGAIPKPVDAPSPVPAYIPCPRCATLNQPSDVYCISCGQRLVPRSGATTSASEPPLPQSPATSSSRQANRLLLVFVAFALVVGLAVGGVAFYHFYKPNAFQPAESTAASQPSEPVPSQGTPETPPQAQPAASDNQTPAVTPESLSPKSLPNDTQATPKTESKSAVTTHPVVPPPAEDNIPSPAVAPASTVAQSDNNAPIPPAPSSPPATADETHSELQEPSPQPSPPPPAPPASPARPTYNGPLSGILVWSGKLGKNDTLTIDGNNASFGSLRG